MLIAVTSSDGNTIDRHFGKAEKFMLYEVGEGEPRLVREVQAPAYCEWSTQLQEMTPEQVSLTKRCMHPPVSINISQLTGKHW